MAARKAELQLVVVDPLPVAGDVAVLRLGGNGAAEVVVNPQGFDCILWRGIAERLSGGELFPGGRCCTGLRWYRVGAC